MCPLSFRGSQLVCLPSTTMMREPLWLHALPAACLPLMRGEYSLCHTLLVFASFSSYSTTFSSCFIFNSQKSNKVFTAFTLHVQSPSQWWSFIPKESKTTWEDVSSKINMWLLCSLCEFTFIHVLVLCTYKSCFLLGQRSERWRRLFVSHGLIRGVIILTLTRTCWCSSVKDLN